MRKSVAAVALATIALVGIGVSDPVEGKTRHVPAKVCRHAWQNPTSQTVNRCQRQGWIIEVDYNDFDHFWQVLVIGPKGHVWVDNLGAIETR